MNPEEEDHHIMDKKNEIRFAFNLLEKLLEYADKAAINMAPIKESSRFSQKDTFTITGQDVKFFTKVLRTIIFRIIYILSNLIDLFSGRVAFAREILPIA
jgi:hypothetical protein